MSVQKRGRIKYADPVKGYGYILEEGASDPSETIHFETDEAEADPEDLLPGTEVTFEVDDDQATQAQKVQTA